MKLKTTIKRSIAACVLLLGAANASAAEPEFTFKLHHMLPPPSNAHTNFLVPWADKVMKESDGRIKIDIYPSMQLGGKPPQLFDQVRKGIVDISWTVTGYTPGRFPKSTVFELPFMAADAKSVSMAIQEYAEQEMADEFKDVHLLAMHVHSPGSLHSRDKAIHTVADLDGMKVRAPNKTMAAAFEGLGANTVFMPVPQMPSALSKGVIDVAVLPFEVVKPLKIHQLVKHHTEIPGKRGLYANNFIFSMNKKAYDSLPPDLQKVIDDNSGVELAGFIGEAFDTYEKTGRQAAIDQGNELYQLPESEITAWKEKLAFVTEDWLKQMKDDGYDSQRLLDKANALIDKYQAANQQ
ncbi:TRAP transporter substrate-binding protein [Amphritea pacifica]|uniref:TRAP transporter substrate-binding protein n=1 Tax=Amphritea pacifica TaxID=2811233 RepID=A0ABS2W8I0_9GAMM|nr:TRAP transporter substrate-binding protein [Amphritea pacifica]MBN0987984.1 TRAP transporter substrate-binding protein [Amphritea pacifica]